MSVASVGTPVTAISASNTAAEPVLQTTTVLPAKSVTSPNLLVTLGSARNQGSAASLTFADNVNGAHALAAPLLNMTSMSEWLALWYRASAATNASTVGTMTEDVANGWRRLIMAELSGYDTATPFGPVVQVLDDITAVGSTIVGSITPQQAGNMILLGGMVRQNSVHVTPPSGWTVLGNVHPTTGVGIEVFLHSYLTPNVDPVPLTFGYTAGGEGYSATGIEVRAPYTPPILPPTVSTTLGAGLASQRGFQGKTGLKPAPFRHGTVR